MGVGTLISLEEYLRGSFHPDRDFVEGQVVERSVGKRRHAYAQSKIDRWFGVHTGALGLEPLTEMRVRVGTNRVRIPDVLVCELPLPDEEVFTSPSYLVVEIMSEEDTMSGLQDRLDDYLRFGVPNIWVIDPWKHRGWRVTADGWAVASDGIMRTTDGRVAMPLADVLLP
jgi:Uma2 family endonuclease